MGRRVMNQETRRNYYFIDLWDFIILIAIAFVIDVRKSIIPNKVTICGTIFGLLFHTLTEGWNGLVFRLSVHVLVLLRLTLALSSSVLWGRGREAFCCYRGYDGVIFVLQSGLCHFMCRPYRTYLLLIHKQMIATGHKLAKWLISIIAHSTRSEIVKRDETSEITSNFPLCMRFVPAVIDSVLFVYYEKR